MTRGRIRNRPTTQYARQANIMFNRNVEMLQRSVARRKLTFEQLTRFSSAPPTPAELAKAGTTKESSKTLGYRVLEALSEKVEFERSKMKATDDLKSMEMKKLTGDGRSRRARRSCSRISPDMGCCAMPTGR